MDLKLKDFIIDNKISLNSIESPIIATACAGKAQDLVQEYTVLKGIFWIAHINMKPIIPMIESIILLEIIKNLKLITPSIERLTNVNANANINLPECLELSSSENFVNGITTLVSQEYNEMKNNIDVIAIKAEEYINNSISSIVHPAYLPLFLLLDEYRYFIQKTDFAEKYKKWKRDYDCFVSNCAPMNGIVKDDSFMWESERTQFILPIDINNGRIRIWKFLGNPPSVTKDKCYELEREYYDFVDQRRRLAEKGKMILYEKGVPDNINPFIELINKYKI